MKKAIFSSAFTVIFIVKCFSQQSCANPDSTGNNLVHTVGYKTSVYGSIPQYLKVGNGKQTLILIPGLGFDGTVFNDFIKENKNRYTIYAVTIPGFGKTQAPPMPTTDTSYGKQNWNKGVTEGLVKLIEKENIQHPIVVGHFTQGTQLALRLAIDYPDKVGGVIVLGGPAKFISIQNGEPKIYPLKGTIAYVDKYTAPTWFKPISKRAFDNGNYLPEVYSLDSIQASKLWKQSATVPLPVMVRYICEFFASDITLEFEKIKCPVLVLRPMFVDKVLKKPVNNYIKPQFIDAWNDAMDKNSLIEIDDIEGASTFIWKDKPEMVNKAIENFIKKKIP